MIMEINTIKNKILPILAPYQITKAGIFGSAARGEMRSDSDVDILVDIEKKISLLDFIGLKMKLEQSLDKKVDLVEYSTIKPQLRARILQEQIQII